jgi:hypothetical protein
LSSAVFAISLETETGDEIEKVIDETGALYRIVTLCLAEAAPLRQTRYIMPRGMAVFNKLQMPSLLTDLDLLRAKADDLQARAIIKRVHSLAIACRARNHAYVKVVGNRGLG